MGKGARAPYAPGMTDFMDVPLTLVVEALRKRETSSAELVKEALRRHRHRGHGLHAYKHLDTRAAEIAAGLADERLANGTSGPLCGIPVSVKDLYGVECQLSGGRSPDGDGPVDGHALLHEPRAGRG